MNRNQRREANRNPRHRDRVIAAHEAAHVVASVWCGIAVAGASIKRRHGSEGRVTLEPWGDSWGLRRQTLERVVARGKEVALKLDARRAAERFAVVFFAGSIAEELLLGGTTAGVNLDFAAAIEVLTRHGRPAATEARLTAYAERLRCRSRRVVRQHWRAVEAVATALLARRRLDGSEVMEIARRAMRDRSQPPMPIRYAGIASASPASGGENIGEAASESPNELGGVGDCGHNGGGDW